MLPHFKIEIVESFYKANEIAPDFMIPDSRKWKEPPCSAPKKQRFGKLSTGKRPSLACKKAFI